ncbi:MAG TPA: hypothetical protein VKU41_08325 [Polyangiaceae bacterium]|nr:hypothetical protein [Polyangiaceae bacterium]
MPKDSRTTRKTPKAPPGAPATPSPRPLPELDYLEGIEQACSKLHAALCEIETSGSGLDDANAQLAEIRRWVAWTRVDAQRAIADKFAKLADSITKT